MTSGRILALILPTALLLAYSLGGVMGRNEARAECVTQRKAERVKPLPQTIYEHYPQAAVPPRFAELAKRLEKGGTR